MKRISTIVLSVLLVGSASARSHFFDFPELVSDSDVVFVGVSKVLSDSRLAFRVLDILKGELSDTMCMVDVEIGGNALSNSLAKRVGPDELVLVFACKKGRNQYGLTSDYQGLVSSSSPDFQDVVEAVRMLNAFEESRIPGLLAVLADQGDTGWKAALDEIIHYSKDLQGNEIAQHLVDIGLNQTNVEITGRAIIAAGAIRHKNAQDAVYAFTRSEDDTVKSAAKTALSEIESCPETLFVAKSTPSSDSITEIKSAVSRLFALDLTNNHQDRTLFSPLFARNLPVESFNHRYFQILNQIEEVNPFNIGSKSRPNDGAFDRFHYLLCGMPLTETEECERILLEYATYIKQTRLINARFQKQSLSPDQKAYLAKRTGSSRIFQFIIKYELRNRRKVLSPQLIDKLSSVLKQSEP